MISLLTPTRGRPKRCYEMAVSAAEMADGEPELVLVVDADDPEADLYADVDWPLPTVFRVMPTRQWPPVKWNEAARLATGDVMFTGQDDVLFRTPHWDTEVEEAFAEWPDRLVLVYTRNGKQDGRFATYPFLSRRWVDELGYFMPEQFVGDFCDGWVFDIAKRVLRTHFLEDVLIEHMHPAFGKAERDRTHREYRAANESSGGAQLFRDTEDQRADEARKLQRVIDDG